MAKGKIESLALDPSLPASPTFVVGRACPRNEECEHGEGTISTARLHQDCPVGGAKAGEDDLAEEAEALADKVDRAEAQASLTPREVKTERS